MADEWRSYDTAAEVHQRIAAPKIFEPVAKDLVARFGMPSAGAILDVGTGTGVAARVALESGPRGAVIVGLDPSAEMLRVARRHGLARVVVGAVPGLPFSSASFDRVLASFVLSHVTDYQSASLDMVRVLRPGGKLGITAWTGAENEYRQFWQSMADSLIGKQALDAAARVALPWEEWFMDPTHLRETLEEAGLIRVEVIENHYSAPMKIAEFLDMRETSAQARFIRGTVDAQEWDRFRHDVSAEFYKRFRDPIEHTRDAYVATGTKP